MAGPHPKRPLPRGVLPVGPEWGDEDPASRVRAKPPPRADETRVRPAETEEPTSPSTVAAPPRTHAEQAAELVGQLVQSGPEQLAPIVRRLLPLGNFALEELARTFPGPLWRPVLATDTRLPRPDEISGCAAALSSFDGEAIPYLARLMRSPRTEARYYATIVCGAFSTARLIEPLARVTLDDDRACRRVAVHLLSGYQHEPRYRDALAELRRCASDASRPMATRRRAISALTQLRDDAATPLFVELLADPDRGIATASRVGLRVLTAHDFGFSREPWLRWLSERGHELRVRWLIEGLGDSRVNIRILASRELWRLTRLLRPLAETAPREEFTAAQRHYERWWSKNPRG